MTDPLQDLQARIQYRFQQLDLLELALTHGSVAPGVADNQRLEFLGDAVLGLVIAESLFTQHPEAPEGILDHMRASIVNGASLSQLARKLDIGAALIVSDAHRQHLPEPSNSMLEDALEALIGAIYLDGGHSAAQRWVQLHFKRLIEQSSKNSLQANPKGRLQEWTQKHHEGAIPIYEELTRSGPDHERSYTVAVRVAGQRLGEGSASSIKEAERLAAEAALNALQTSE